MNSSESEESSGGRSESGPTEIADESLVLTGQVLLPVAVQEVEDGTESS